MVLAVFVAFLPLIVRLVDRGTTSTIAVVADDLRSPPARPT